MSIFSVIPNRDERTMARGLLAKLKKPVSLVASLRESLEEIKKAKQIDFIAVDGSAGDRALKQQAGAETAEKDLSVFEFLEIVNELPFTPLIMVCCSETTSQDEMFRFGELGVDIILKRPFASKELTENFAKAGEMLASPPQEFKIRQSLRAMIRAGDFGNAEKTLAALVAAQPTDARSANMYAQVLMKLGTPESLAKAKQALDTLEDKLPQSISVKKRLYDLYRITGPLDKVFDMAVAILKRSPDADTLATAVKTGIEISDAKEMGSRPFLRILNSIIEMPVSKTKQEALVSVSAQALERAQDSDQLYQFIEVFEKMDVETMAKTLDSLSKALVRIKEIDDFTFAKVARMVQKIMPGEPTTLARLVEILLDQGDAAAAELIVGAAKAQKVTSANFYVASAKLSLAQGFLREASEITHAGRKAHPGDDRWNALADEWKKKNEEAAQKKPG